MGECLRLYRREKGKAGIKEDQAIEVKRPRQYRREQETTETLQTRKRKDGYKSRPGTREGMPEAIQKGRRKAGYKYRPGT